MTIKQTAGRDQLGEFAPDFAHFNMTCFLVRTGIVAILTLKHVVSSRL